MEKKQQLQIALEVFWWLMTAILVVIILFPIWREAIDFPFYVTNVLFIILFVTFSRYLFLLKHTFLARRQVLKMILLVALIPLVFYLVQEVNFFQTFLDEQGGEALVGALSMERIGKLTAYVKSELLFFGVGAVIAAVALFFRLIISIWRYHNRGTI
jgi:hypothetical protein